jgi:hypothetical protein
VRSRLNQRIRTTAAVFLFAGAVAVALLRVGTRTEVGGLRLGAPLALNDFYSAVYYPVRAFLQGENPHDRERLHELYPQVEAYPPYLPFNLVLHLPFGLLPPRAAGITYFIFSALLTLPLALAALRLAGIPPSVRRVALLAALLLLSRPGHWTLVSGQHAILLTLLSYLALLHAKRSPIYSAIALGICMYKPTYGIPLAVLMLAAGYGRAVGIGLLVAGAVNLPPLLLLSARVGGLGLFARKLLAGYRDWQNLEGMDPGSSLDPITFNRIDLATFVGRFVGHAVSPALSVILTVVVLAATSLALRRLRKQPGRAAEDVSVALVCLGTLIAVYHMTYDLILLSAPLAALVARGVPTPAPAAGRVGFLVLYAIPALNWILTVSFLQAWQPAHPVWLAVASTNAFCLLVLFAGYLTLALSTTTRHPASADLLVIPPSG